MILFFEKPNLFIPLPCLKPNGFLRPIAFKVFHDPAPAHFSRSISYHSLSFCDPAAFSNSSKNLRCLKELFQTAWAILLPPPSLPLTVLSDFSFTFSGSPVGLWQWHWNQSAQFNSQLCHFQAPPSHIILGKLFKSLGLQFRIWGFKKSVQVRYLAELCVSPPYFLTPDHFKTPCQIVSKTPL